MFGNGFEDEMFGNGFEDEIEDERGVRAFMTRNMYRNERLTEEKFTEDGVKYCEDFFDIVDDVKSLNVNRYNATGNNVASNIFVDLFEKTGYHPMPSLTPNGAKVPLKTLENEEYSVVYKWEHSSGFLLQLSSPKPHYEPHAWIASDNDSSCPDFHARNVILQQPLPLRSSVHNKQEVV